MIIYQFKEIYFNKKIFFIFDDTLLFLFYSFFFYIKKINRVDE